MEYNQPSEIVKDINFGEKAKSLADKGYTALKFDPFGSEYLRLNKESEIFIKNIVRSVRDAVGPNVELSTTLELKIFFTTVSNMMASGIFEIIDQPIETKQNANEELLLLLLGLKIFLN